LPELISALRKAEVDASTRPRIVAERAALAVIDGGGSLPLLALADAAEVAVQKAREYGTGTVRVRNLGPVRSALTAVAEIAYGPAIGFAFGPDGAWSAAFPSRHGLPVLGDARLGSEPDALAEISPWLPLVSGGEWLIGAIAVGTLEPLVDFHERVSRWGIPKGFLDPATVEERRAVVERDGIRMTGALKKIFS
jgi:hypothetical protein